MGTTVVVEARVGWVAASLLSSLSEEEDSDDESDEESDEDSDGEAAVGRDRPVGMWQGAAIG